MVLSWQLSGGDGDRAAVLLAGGSPGDLVLPRVSGERSPLGSDAPHPTPDATVQQSRPDSGLARGGELVRQQNAG